VLRSVWGAAPGGASAAAGSPLQGQAAPADPEAAAAATEETAAAQAAATALVPLAKVMTPHLAAPAAKPDHAGKQDHRADAARAADPGISTAGPDVMPVTLPEPVAAPAVPVNPAIDPSADAVAAAPALASGDLPVPVSIGPRGGGTLAQGITPSQPVNGTAGKRTASAETASDPVAVPVQTQAGTVDVPTAAVIGMVRQTTVPIAPVSSGVRPAASSDGLAAGGAVPPMPVPKLSDSSGQVEAVAADTNAPSQPVPGAGSDVPGQATAAVPAPSNQKLGPATAAETASQAAPGGDHKVTLRPVEAGGDPAKPTAASVTAQQAVMPATSQVTMPVTATPTATVAAPHAATPASAMEQLAPALLTLAKTADGGQQMTVRLHPADLGMVQVRIAQAASGTTQIEISADNPATLLALQRDQPQLHRTLDDAGIAAAGRTVTFHVAQPAQAAAGGNGAGSSNGQGANQQASAGRTGAGSTDADGSAGGGRGSYAARERTVYPGTRRSGAALEAVGAASEPAGISYRIGLDITA
jgi:flagellar hook-length control protein FliK